MVQMKEQCGRRRKVAIRVEHAQGHRVRLTVTKNTRERRQVHPVRHEIKRLYARYRLPQERVNSARVNPRIDGGDTGGLSVNADFRLPECCASAALKFRGHVVGNAGVPELIADLAL